MPTFGSLFSGIGGLDLGLERAGWKCKWQVEIDPYCRAVLEKHWPDVPKWDDAKTFPPNAGFPRCPTGRTRSGEAALEEVSDSGFTGLGVDLVCGGFPCQPVSVAGRRAGTDDLRWLWPEFRRILGLLRPRYVLMENVPGLLAINGGRAFAGILGDLAALGYDAEWESLPSAAFGAPHLRYRVFLVAKSSPLGRGGRKDDEGAQEAERNGVAAGGAGDVADPDAERRNGWPRVFGPGWWRESTNNDWWAIEPDMGRVAHGVPARVDRLRALGNAVVPQVAEWVGRQILKAWGTEVKG